MKLHYHVQFHKNYRNYILSPKIFLTSATLFFFLELTHFQQIFHFFIPLKQQKTSFQRSTEVEHWLKIG